MSQRYDLCGKSYYSTTWYDNYCSLCRVRQRVPRHVLYSFNTTDHAQNEDVPGKKRFLKTISLTEMHSNNIRTYYCSLHFQR